MTNKENVAKSLKMYLDENDKRKITEYSLDNKMTFKEMANKMKVDQGNFSKLINGKMPCTQKMLIRIEKAFGIKLYD